MSELVARSTQRCFGGTQSFYEHASSACGSTMKLSVYLPPQVEHGPVGAVFYLAGLTCTEETFVIKAGAQRVAAELGLALIAPDTSPRVERYPGDDLSWDFGVGAGFYVDATVEPWARTYKMFSYVTRELPELLCDKLPIDRKRLSVMGHSMGGHGALVAALRAPEVFRSASALAPICAPMQCPWGEKAFAGYLGEDRSKWAEYDACELLKSKRFAHAPLIDQGLADKFLAGQLKPELLEARAAEVGQQVQVRRHEGYDHSYYFVQTFIEAHLRYHAAVWG